MHMRVTMFYCMCQGPSHVGAVVLHRQNKVGVVLVGPHMAF